MRQIVTSLHRGGSKIPPRVRGCLRVRGLTGMAEWLRFGSDVRCAIAMTCQAESGMKLEIVAAFLAAEKPLIQETSASFP